MDENKRNKLHDDVRGAIKRIGNANAQCSDALEILCYMYAVIEQVLTEELDDVDPNPSYEMKESLDIALENLSKTQSRLDLLVGYLTLTDRAIDKEA